MALSEIEEFEFRARAEAEAQAATVVDPDIPVPGHAMDAPAKPAEAPASMLSTVADKAGKFARGKLGDLEAGGALLTGMAGSIPGMVLGGANAAVRQAMGRGGPGFKEGAMEGASALTRTPRTPEGKEALGGLQEAVSASKLEGLGPTGGMLMGGMSGSGKLAGPALRQVGAPVGALLERGAKTIGAGASKVGEFAGDVIGRRVAPSREAAGIEARKAVEEGMAKLSKAGQQDELRVKAIGDVEKRLEAQLETERTVPADLGKIGASIRGTFNETMENAKTVRADIAKEQFAEVMEKAAAKEATGARVDTSEIEGELNAMLEKAAGIPDLEVALKNALSTVAGKEVDPAAGAGRAPAAFQAESLLAAIQKKGGISINQISDLTGEGRVGNGVKGLRPGLFTRNGQGLGDLANALREEGWDIPNDMVDGGVQALRDLIQKELRGEKVYSIADTDRETVHRLSALGRDAALEQEPYRPGKTFEQLEVARRKLNDIAFSRDMEGYGAIFRGEAKKAAKALDRAMQEFVPEFGEYKAKYRQMSEPLETLGTRFGRALHDTEGGLQGEAYAKVSDQNLPGRIFSTREGIEQMIDAVAGGKGASPQYRSIATKQVGVWVEQWIRETTRTMQPTKALEKLSEPGMRASLQSLPNVEAALKKQFGDISGMDRTAKQLAKMHGELAERGAEKTQAAAAVRTEIQKADDLASLPGEKSQKKALSILTKALDSGLDKELIPRAQWNAARVLIDKAETIEEKTNIARRIATLIGVTAGAGAVGAEGVKYLQ
jgi:hypothetical protein